MDFKIRESRTVAQGRKRLLRERETYFLLMQQGFSNNPGVPDRGHQRQDRPPLAQWPCGRQQAQGGTTGSSGGAAFWSVPLPPGRRADPHRRPVPGEGIDPGDRC
ncbi:hypothetical protein [Streptomyces badius]